MRESMAFLKENSHKWQERKVTECEKMKQEAKEDRLAVSRMKKKRFGIKRLSKEENKRLKERAEDRILLAKARGNLWKLARNPEERDMEDREEEAWRVMGEGAMEFTEKDDWEDDYKVDIEGLLSGGLMKKPRLEVKMRSGSRSGEQEHEGECE